MSFDPLKTGQPAATAKENWIDGYKEAFVEANHDDSQLSLVLPDDCLIVIGPARISMANNSTGDEMFYPVGYANMISYSEMRSVQPIKDIGSRRHAFSATNSPVRGTISRLMFMGANLYHALYALSKLEKNITARNSKYDESSGTAPKTTWYANLEEDLARIPFGLGVIYNTPKSMSESKSADSRVAGAEYLECCVLVDKSTSISAGQTMIMEQVNFMADRIVPFLGYNSGIKGK